MHKKHCIYHCDIKPENIFINENNQVKLIDFGFSKCLEQQEHPLRYSCNIPIGSSSYNPPEAFTSNYSLEQVDCTIDD